MIVVEILIVAAVVVWCLFARPAPSNPAHQSTEREMLERLGWRDKGQREDEKWPIKYAGTADRIPWTISVNPARENPDGLATLVDFREDWELDGHQKDKRV